MPSVNTAKIQYIEAQGSEGGVILARISSSLFLPACSLPRLSTRYEYTCGLRKEALPNTNWAKAELKAKCSSPPATRSRGLIAVCRVAIADPITNSETTATP